MSEPAIADLSLLDEALFARALPLWWPRGWDAEHGGFYDRLDRELRPVPLPGKRLLVQYRQLFVYANADAIAPGKGWDEVARQTYRFLVDRYWDRAHGGWFFSVAADGTPHDRAKDFYGHAFAVFALSQVARHFGDADAVGWADRTVALLDEHLAAPQGGFWEAASEDWRPRTDERRQNPHMHYLEALLALYEVTGEARHRAAAEAMIALFERSFVDAATGTLGEYFDAAWQPLPGKGEIVEPGHHFEWYWLLHRSAELFRTEPLPLADRLFGWAAAQGIDVRDGGVFDQLDRTGEVLLDTKRLWPLCEAIRAFALRCRIAPDPASRQTLNDLVAYFGRAYADPGRGFREHLDRAGRPIVDQAYASSVYHVLGAAIELRRLQTTATSPA